MAETVDLIEKSILASIFDEPDLFGTVSENIDGEDFADPRHSYIFSGMRELYMSNEEINPLTLLRYGRNQGVDTRMGGFQYLAEVSDPKNIYGKSGTLASSMLMLKDAAMKRRLHTAAAEIVQMSSGESRNTGLSVAEFAERKFGSIAESGVTNGSTVNIKDEFKSVLDEIREREAMPEGAFFGVPTGFPELDENTGGFRGGQMVIVAGRPAMGKTTLATDFCRAAALRAGKTVLFFSLEMGKRELMERVMAAESQVLYQKIKSGRGLDRDDWDKLRRVEETLHGSNLIVDDTAETTMTEIKVKAERIARSATGLDMIVIDYVGLIDTKDQGFNDNRQMQVSGISRSVKMIAKSLDVPVVLLSQLNRGKSDRAEKRPQISDLRESGSLEQDADIVLMVHRPEYYDPNDSPGKAELIVGKNRNGPSETINLISLLEVSKFAPSSGMFPRNIKDMEQDAETARQQEDYDPGYDGGSSYDDGAPASTDYGPPPTGFTPNENPAPVEAAW